MRVNGLIIGVLILIVFLCIKSTEVAAEPEQKTMIITEAEIIQPTQLMTCEVKEKTAYLGEFTLTAYCSCEKCCNGWASDRPVDAEGNEIVIGSTGNVLTANHSIAVDPEVIPYGTEIVINGQSYIAEDCGAAIKGNRIDIYFNDHDEALQFGVQVADVFVREVYR